MSTLCSMLQRTGSWPFPDSSDIKRYHGYDSDPIHPVEGCTPQDLPFWHFCWYLQRLWWSILRALQIGVRKENIVNGGCHCMYMWAYITSLDYRIPTRNNVLIATISKIWRLNTKTFQNLCLPLNHPTSMPNMSANKKNNQKTKITKSRTVRIMLGLGSKDGFPYFFFGFKSQKQKDHEFFWVFPTFVGIPFGFCCFGFMWLKAKTNKNWSFCCSSHFFVE